MMLKRSGEKEHPSLVPDLSKKISSFSSLSVMLTISLLQMFFTKLMKVHAIPSYLTVLS